MQSVITIIIILSGMSAGAIQNDSSFIPCAKTFGGDYYLPKNDTIEEDITISGGRAKIDGVISGDLGVMGGEAIVNGLVDGDIAVFGGNLEIFGRAAGDASIVGGEMLNKGVIEGDIEVIGGTVALDSGSVVKGDINIVGGTVDRDEHAEVGGRIVALDIGKLDKIFPRMGKIFSWQKGFGPWGGVFKGLFLLSALIVIYLLNLLVLLIFPKAVDSIGDRIRGNVWVAVAIGIGIEIVYVPLILLFTVSIIGIPLIPAFALAVFVAGLFGFSAISVIIGERITAGINWKINNRIGLFSLGWFALMIILIFGLFLQPLGFIGLLIFILGLVILFVAMTIGLGGVLYTLVKKEKTAKK